jgi:hypothetical protein
MIVFLGDSFTWGQGLQIPYWIEQGKSIDEINDLMPPKVALESVMDYTADEYRKTYHFPNLVAKHFNRPYSTKWGNGGNNDDIIFFIKNLFRNIVDPKGGVDYVIVQFTDSQRDINLLDYIEKGRNPDIVLQEHCRNTINKLNHICKEQNIKWFGFSWRDDIGSILEHDFQDNYIPILYNGKEYNNFNILRDQCEFMFDCIIDPRLTDSHLNSKGHKVIADSIIKKLSDSHIY